MSTTAKLLLELVDLMRLSDRAEPGLELLARNYAATVIAGDYTK